MVYVYAVCSNRLSTSVHDRFFYLTVFHAIEVALLSKVVDLIYFYSLKRCCKRRFYMIRQIVAFALVNNIKFCHKAWLLGIGCVEELWSILHSACDFFLVLLIG